MNPASVLLLLIACAAYCEAACPTNGVWSEWTTGPCPTTCGSKSNATRTRTCITLCGDCPCVGDATDIGPCGIALCPYPNPTCQSPYKKSLNGKTQTFFCGTASVPVDACP